MKIAVPDLLSNAYFPAEAAVEPGFFHSEKLDISLKMAAPVEAHAALRGLIEEAAPYEAVVATQFEALSVALGDGNGRASGS